MNDNYIKIYEAEGTERVWFQDVLDDNNIPYRIEIEPYWTGIQISVYHERQIFFVDPVYESAVLGFIGEYSEGSFAEDDSSADYAESGELPQVNCLYCGKQIDFDYPKCPHCGKALL